MGPSKTLSKPNAVIWVSGTWATAKLIGVYKCYTACINQIHMVAQQKGLLDGDCTIFLWRLSDLIRK